LPSGTTDFKKQFKEFGQDVFTTIDGQRVVMQQNLEGIVLT